MAGGTAFSQLAGASNASDPQATRSNIEACDHVQYMKMRDALISGSLTTRVAPSQPETPSIKRQGKASTKTTPPSTNKAPTPVHIKPETTQHPLEFGGEAHSESQTPTKRVRRQRGGVILPATLPTANPANSTTPTNHTPSILPTPPNAAPATPDHGTQADTAEEGMGNGTMTSLATLMAMNEVNQALFDAGIGAPNDDMQEGHDWCAGGSTMQDGVTSMGPSSENDPSRARMRREKNRVAARKCRAKKVQFMAKMQTELKELMAQNNEIKNQVVTWHRMFTREVRLREAMKRLIQAVWGSTAVAAATGHSAHDVLLGLEAGTLDINTLVPHGSNDQQSLSHLADPMTGLAPLPPGGLLPPASAYLPHGSPAGLQLHLQQQQQPGMFAGMGKQAVAGAEIEPHQSPHIAMAMHAGGMHDMADVMGSPGAHSVSSNMLSPGVGRPQVARRMTQQVDTSPSAGPPTKKRCAVENNLSDESPANSRGAGDHNNNGGSPVGEQAPSFASKSSMQHSPFAAACGATALQRKESRVTAGNQTQDAGLSTATAQLNAQQQQAPSPRIGAVNAASTQQQQPLAANGPLRIPAIRGHALPSASASLEALLNTLVGTTSLSTPGSHIPAGTNGSSLLPTSLLNGINPGGAFGLPCPPDLDTDMCVADMQRGAWNTSPRLAGMGLGQAAAAAVTAHMQQSPYTYNCSLSGSANSEGTRLVTSQLAGAQQVTDRILQKGDSLSRDCATPATTSSALTNGRRSSLGNAEVFMRSQQAAGHASGELMGCLAAGSRGMSITRIGSLDWLADLLTMSTGQNQQQMAATCAPSMGAQQQVARPADGLATDVAAAGDV